MESPDPAARVQALIEAAERGDDASATELFTELYRELHRLAASQLRRNGAATLGATTLVHEAYMDMCHRDGRFPDQGRFFAYAARAMRGLIVDYVRERRAQKRGGEFHLTALDTRIGERLPAAEPLTALRDALLELERLDPPLAELVDLKYFCGFSLAEIAAQRGVSERTVQRDWQKAKLFLHHVLEPD